MALYDCTVLEGSGTISLDIYVKCSIFTTEIVCQYKWKRLNKQACSNLKANPIDTRVPYPTINQKLDGHIKNPKIKYHASTS